jgi:hypothetical protein
MKGSYYLLIPDIEFLGFVNHKEALAFVERQGVVLQAARGPLPNLAEWIVGGRIRGSWWGHPKGKEIFCATDAESILSPWLKLIGRA